MNDRITHAFNERGISPLKTRVGWDVICRVGNPCDPQDLRKVGAHTAVGIAVMMNEKDFAEDSAYGCSNSATFRTVLALRHVLFAGEHNSPWDNLRIVVPL